jgi:branched-chain amino acid transport system substrate-binding protein
VCIASSDVFAQAKIPVLAPTSTNPQVTLGNSHFFRLCFLDPFQGTVLANFAVDQFKAQKAYVLAKLGDDYSVGLATYFKQAFEALGGEAVYETFPEGTSDYNSYVTNAKNGGADVFFSPTSTEAAAQIIEQAAAQGWDKPILAGDTWDSNVITGAAQGKPVTLFITTFYQEGGNADFDAGFKAWLNANPDMLRDNNGNDQISAISVMAYDAYFTMLEAVKLAGSTDSVAINEALWNTKYDGVTGHIEFDDIGDAVRSDAVVKQVNTETGLWDFVAIQGVK